MASETTNLKEKNSQQLFEKQKSENEENHSSSKVLAPSKFNIKEISLLSESIIDYLSIGIVLFIFGYYNLDWFDIKEKINKQFFLYYFLIAGIILYIIGIFNWHEGRELLFLMNFILSFYFVAYFLKEQNLNYISEKYEIIGTKLSGIFYILIFTLFLVISISSKSKGIFYILNLYILSLAFLFLFLHKFLDYDWIKTVYSYIFVVSGVLYWLIGILKLINSMLKTSMKILQPSD